MVVGMELAARPISRLRDDFRRELFDVVLPFWERHGIDHQHGGFLCSLGHDGTLINSRKFLWFQGRGIWLYSFLYNHFGGNPQHLAIARRAKEFLLRHAPQPNGYWAEALDRDGTVLQPFQGDIYGMYFAVEGLAEYAQAAGDEEALETALIMFRRLFAETRHPVAGPPPQGVWMLRLLIATRLLQRGNPEGVSEIADRSVEAIMERHYNPETGLNAELLEEPEICVFGHTVECLWMVMDEADRRKDAGLWKCAAERLRHHLDVGSDHVYGGLAAAVCVDRGGYEWPVERPVETGLEFRQTGEYHYMKSFWSINEVQVATLKVFERTGAAWAARYFGLAQQAAEQRFSLKGRNFPLYLLFTDRRFSFQPNINRQDNYHFPRQLLFNLQALERLAEVSQCPQSCTGFADARS